MTVTEQPNTVVITATVVVTKTLSESPEEIYSVTILRIHQDGRQLEFSGTAVCPDGTVLRSQLFEDDTPVPWWPANEDILVANGEWYIMITLGENSVPPILSTGPFYLLKIWMKDNPGVSDGKGFDLVGPPTLSTSALASLNLVPTLDALPENRWVEDDLMYIPTGLTYRNARDPGASFGWPYQSPQTVKTTLTQGAKTIDVYYRAYIETGAGDFRNNIIQLSGVDPVVDNTPDIYVENAPDAFSFARIGEDDLGFNTLADAALLKITVKPGTQEGEYKFEIGIVLNGSDLGTVPCAVKVVA